MLLKSFDTRSRNPNQMNSYLDLTVDCGVYRKYIFLAFPEINCSDFHYKENRVVKFLEVEYLGKMIKRLLVRSAIVEIQ